jgi:hypothetical protein
MPARDSTRQHSCIRSCALSDRHTRAGCSQQNTPQTGRAFAYVRIIHPHHPLHGQRVGVVRQTGPEADRQWVIELNDQTHACIPLSWAVPDDNSDTPGTNSTAAGLWADVTGLLKLARMVHRLRAIEPTEVMSDESTTKDCGPKSPDSPNQCAFPLGEATSQTPTHIDDSIDGDDGQAAAGPVPPAGGE